MQSELPRFGTGLWHFGQFRARSAAHGSGPEVSTLGAIKIAGSVAGLSVADLNYSFNPAGTRLAQVSQSLEAGLAAVALTPETYTRSSAAGVSPIPTRGSARRPLAWCPPRPTAPRALGCE